MRLDRGGQLVVEPLGEGAQLDQLPGTRADSREPSDRHRRAVDRERRDHDVHPRPVLEPRIHHRAELVDPAPQRRQDPLDRIPQRSLGREAHIGPLDPAAALDIDPVVPVHHHLLDRRISEQLLERPEAYCLSEDQLAEALACEGLEDGRVLVHQIADRLRQRTEIRGAGGGLGAPALDQAAPELAGTVLQDVITPFSFAALNISGAVQNRVVREDGTGTLDFYWRILVDPASTGGGIGAFRLTDFGYSNLTDADWRIDGVGANGPDIGRLFNPATHPDGAINFLFDPSVAAGAAGSNFFFLHTSATNCALTANYDLLGGPNQTLSDVFQTFAPSAVPEPSSWPCSVSAWPRSAS